MWWRETEWKKGRMKWSDVDEEGDAEGVVSLRIWIDDGWEEW